MTVRSVFNPNNHSWETVPNWSLRRFTRWYLSLKEWAESRRQKITFESIDALKDTLTAAAKARHSWEERNGKDDAWPAWYAEWIANNQRSVNAAGRPRFLGVEVE